MSRTWLTRLFSTPCMAVLLPVLAFLLVWSSAPPARAQTGHVHNWSAEPTMQSRGAYLFPDRLEVENHINAGRVAGGLRGLLRHYDNDGVNNVDVDLDKCLNPDCPICGNGRPGYSENKLKAICWTASRSGGQFGYLDDSSGQFVPSSDPEVIKAYKCPPTPGPVTVGVKVDDIPGYPSNYVEIPTADDTPVVATQTIEVIGYTDDATWNTYTPIACDGIISPKSNPAPGGNFTCKVAPAIDIDERVGTSTGTTRWPSQCTYSWTATGGEFYSRGFDVYGRRAQGAQSGREVSWQSSGPGQYTITVTIEDIPLNVGDNDPALQFSITVQVAADDVNVWYPEAGNVYPYTKNGVMVGGGISAPADSAAE